MKRGFFDSWIRFAVEVVFFGSAGVVAASRGHGFVAFILGMTTNGALICLYKRFRERFL